MQKSVAFARFSRRRNACPRLPAAAGVAAAEPSAYIAASAADVTPAAAAPGAARAAAHVRLAGIGLPAAGVRRILRAGIDRALHSAEVLPAEEFVAQPCAAEAAEQTAPEAAAPAPTAVPGAVSRAVPGAVVPPGACAHQRANDEEDEQADDDPPKHAYVYSARRGLLRVAARRGGRMQRAQMRSVHVQDRVDAVRDARVEIAGAELRAHIRYD